MILGNPAWPVVQRGFPKRPAHVIAAVERPDALNRIITSAYAVSRRRRLADVYGRKRARTARPT